MSKIKEMLNYALVDKGTLNELHSSKIMEDEKVIEAYKALRKKERERLAEANAEEEAKLAKENEKIERKKSGSFYTCSSFSSDSVSDSDGEPNSKVKK
jgi:hypothetical protein